MIKLYRHNVCWNNFKDSQAYLHYICRSLDEEDYLNLLDEKTMTKRMEVYNNWFGFKMEVTNDSNT